MSKNVSLLVILAMTVNLTVSAESINNQDLKAAVAFYNSFKTTSLLIETLKVSASPSDKSFLSKLQSQAVNQKKPEVSVKGSSIYIDGLPNPVTVDLKTKKFRYRGTNFTIDFNQSIESSVNNIATILNSGRASLLDLIIPNAEANAGVELVIAGLIIYTLGLGAAGFGGICAGLRTKEENLCLAKAIFWPVVAVYYLVEAVTKSVISSFDEITCDDSPAVILRYNGQKKMTLRKNYSSGLYSVNDEVLTGNEKKAAAALFLACERYPYKIEEANRAFKEARGIPEKIEEPTPNVNQPF